MWGESAWGEAPWGSIVVEAAAAVPLTGPIVGHMACVVPTPGALSCSVPATATLDCVVVDAWAFPPVCFTR